ncbi:MULTISPECIES: 2-dehydropantoate 2-reductase [Oleiagrimonas]|uniref:2-dehydropantoate 2-reductase n=1 Tax=Oleiagrimonas citrea TaxID=1665687 RepID=A0A846ZP49_9GAMM|nr:MULTISPECIES: 2-dehydropantoate 2-reductase [Oleiagrimonas]NKZ39338.1 2-dehydropantoate 2-reductase [Oleiagrimonas citrea]RAP59684.1 2-dehydropantoate 2-reductase [Oleiagrimonas sp. MCCC 1A03011]
MNEPHPEIAVIGAGSIGCFVGGHLGMQTRVRLVGRERVRAVIAEHGMRLTDLDGGRVERLPQDLDYVTDITVARTAELVLITVKSDDTPAVAQALAPVLRESAVVLSLQNGLQNVPVLREALPKCTVLAGMVPFNVLHRGHGRLHRASAGTLMAERHAALAPFAATFAACGLPLELRDDMREVQWAKLLLNLNNGVNALSDLPLREELALRDYRRCLALLQDEALRALKAAGIRPARLTPLPARWLPTLLRAPDAVFGLLAQRLLAIDPLARSSTWEDLAAGRRTEIEHINGEVVRLASRQGMPAPANARLLALVHEAEQGDRRIWRRSELWDELRTAAESR